MSPETPKKVYIETHGCQMNEYDSRKMADVLAAHGAVTRVFAPEEADILLANTCSVREKAQEKVFSELGRWRELKNQNPNVLIGVGGCVASQEGEAILQRAPFVDVVFGPQTLHRLPELIAARQTQKRAMVDVSFPEIEKFDKLPEPTTDGPTAFVSIMEGCSKYCTYCVVPYTRGVEISRPLDDVIIEIVQLAAQGVREVTLLGQNVNGYFGKKHDGSTCDFAELLYLVAEIDGIERIRFTTSHPLHFDARQIQAFKDLPKLANYIHLPVQAGNDRILGAMKRGYTVAQYEAKIAALRAVRPNISISTDFIVGFPTETESEFEDTMNLIGRVGFDQAFSFMYSPRPGTPAAMLVDNIPLVEKKRRLHILQARIAQFGQNYRENLLGSVQTVLVERDAKRAGQQCGRLGSNHIVNFECDPALRGKLLEVKITALSTNSFIGEAVLPIRAF